MKTALLFLTAILPTIPLHAENKATALWLPESATATPGKTYRTVVRLTVDEGWHTYWENPGEGGLPVKITAEMPAGWILGPILFPAPKAFMTGDLHGFGYEGKILFPITITPPADLKTESALPTITATLTWLTCDDSACLPGKAELTLSPPDPDLVEIAYSALPTPVPGAKLDITDQSKSLELLLSLPANWKVDISDFKVFPVTRNVIDPSADFRFTPKDKSTNTWTASVPKSEYLDGAPKYISIILVGSEGRTWKISTASAPHTSGS